MKLFLASYFEKVAPVLKKYTGCVGEKVLFITTASKVEDVNFYVEEDRRALLELGFVIEDLDVSIETPSDIQNKIERCDCIFIEGGNTFYLLQELKRTGTDQMILEHIRKNKLYIGVSAGAMIVSEHVEYAKYMDDLSFAPELRGNFSALNLINFSIVPHYQNAPFEKAGEKIMEAYTDSLQLCPISNNQVVVVIGNTIDKITL